MNDPINLTGYSDLAELPRKLRIAAAVGHRVTVVLPSGDARKAAGLIERGQREAEFEAILDASCRDAEASRDEAENLLSIAKAVAARARTFFLMALISSGHSIAFFLAVGLGF